MQSGVAVAVPGAQTGSCSSDSIPCPELPCGAGAAVKKKKKKKKEEDGVPWWPSGEGFGIITSVAWVQSLAWEFSNAVGTAFPPQKKRIINMKKTKNTYFLKMEH